jgi:subtilisin family serine protease
MCDIVPGELIVSWHQDDAAAATLIDRIRGGESRVPHIEFIERLEERLKGLELEPRENLTSKFVRLRVPAGEEVFKINILQFLYRREQILALTDGRFDLGRHRHLLIDSRNQFQVVPNSWLTTSFAFARPRHDDYKKLFKWTGPSASTRNVLIIDSGLASVRGFLVTDRRNFVDPARPRDVKDDHSVQHGTAIAEIIRDLCPKAPLTIYKVVDAKDRASEWDTLAALAARSSAEVINLSLSFGLKNGTCGVCGRESHSSRSAVFESLLDQVATSPGAPIVVTAAGNDSANELTYPARFGSVVAIESVNQALDLSEFSNRGTTDHEGNPHDHVFVLPGGERLAKASAPAEWLGTAASGDEILGTSFAAAYASGLIAHHWSQAAHRKKNAAQLLAWLGAHADTSMPNYAQATYGHGLMRA